MKQNRIFAMLQLGTSGIATLLVLIAFFVFNQPLQNALKQLDSMAGSAESEIKTVQGLLDDVDKIAESLQKALPSHRKSIASVGDSTIAIAETVAEWEKEIPGFQTIVTDAAHICDTFASQLPIRIPAVTIEKKLIKFQLPEVIPKTQKVDIPYPTATVQTATKRLSYPNGARVEMKKFEKSFGRIMGKSLGGISIQYPSGLSVSNGRVELRYPSGISIGSANRSFTIPATPEYRMKDYSFDVPDKLELKTRELMKDEKALLIKSSAQLNSIHGSLGTTHASFAKIRSLLEKDIKKSLKKTDQNLVDAETAMTTFRTERIPKVLEDLGKQRNSLNKSRDVFTAISSIVPLLFAILGLITAAIAVSGGAKLSAIRQNATA